jgi:hypothetical protein
MQPYGGSTKNHGTAERVGPGIRSAFLIITPIAGNYFLHQLCSRKKPSSMKKRGGTPSMKFEEEELGGHELETGRKGKRKKSKEIESTNRREKEEIENKKEKLYTGGKERKQ